ncbi:MULTISPECIES: class I SAM-dependent methyltransferase [Paenibacillus]|uniref:Class I SAM-dependent methyltransferase n=1 Tax=Paenibacillus violae TaxID=3077234 RepID=A0ABU3R7U7_9BACL|nr:MULTISPECIES: class I SAM-dependent methyltransferase [Paenibacillus]MDU0200353.1 class I SAM-dependent methyltransferase [Paenibacillus sp. PFR10]MEC0265851.1 class I SAM-dependent methyltransferase [Paenibacillus anseongense]
MDSSNDSGVKQVLKASYDQQARQRDGETMQQWKIDELNDFLARLDKAGGSSKRVLDLGSGPGHQADYLREHGCEVVCIDLSEEMVAICREKGLEAYVMDFFALDLQPASFDAVWSMNTLLHVPKDNLLQVLRNVERVLKPDGFFYLGLYGGYESEGIWENDSYRPQRFFAFYEDEHIQKKVREVFALERFHVLQMPEMQPNYQSIIAKRRQLNP